MNPQAMAQLAQLQAQMQAAGGGMGDEPSSGSGTSSDFYEVIILIF